MPPSGRDRRWRTRRSGTFTRVRQFDQGLDELLDGLLRGGRAGVDSGLGDLCDQRMSSLPQREGLRSGDGPAMSSCPPPCLQGLFRGNQPHCRTGLQLLAPVPAIDDARGWSQNRRRRGARHLEEHFQLPVMESGDSTRSRDLSCGLARLLLDHLVRIEKGTPHLRGEQTADGGLPCSHVPNQGYVPPPTSDVVQLGHPGPFYTSRCHDNSMVTSPSSSVRRTRAPDDCKMSITSSAGCPKSLSPTEITATSAPTADSQFGSDVSEP